MRKFIVTDPCYILPGDDWHDCCDGLVGENFDEQEFDRKVQEKLREYLGTESAWACGTGIGDWSNSIETKDQDIAKLGNPYFCADAGMVCVCEVTDVIKNLDIIGEGHTCADFDVEDDDDVTCKFDTSDANWTVVKVSVNGELVILSEESEEDIVDEDEDDYSSYFDDEDEDEDYDDYEE